MPSKTREQIGIFKKLFINSTELLGGVLLSSGQLVDLAGIADSLVLDDDGDTTISAPTDDQIDIEVAGADDFRITANTFTALSGSTIATDTIAETTTAAGVTADSVLLKDGTSTHRNPVVAVTGDGAITIPNGNTTYFITKAGVAAMTLADPTADDDDGLRLTFMATTANAHTLDNSAGSGFNAGGAGADEGTFGGAIGDSIVLEAYQGVWYVINNINVTLA